MTDKLPPGNRILAALPQATLARLRPHLHPTPLPVGKVLYEPGGEVRHVYFPTRGMVSLITELEGTGTLEVATMGREGFAGLPAFLGTVSFPWKAFIQVPGEALRIDAERFRKECRRDAELRDRALRYVHAMLVQTAQAVACNRVHALEERCSRWLLMVHDRMDGDELPLTQEFIAQMLGVRRAGVTVAAGTLQKAGLIRYRRGTVRVVDRKGLEASACACYRVMRDELERVLGA